VSSAIKISIPQPCHEGWQNMLPAEKGRFCQTCQKCVIDFSTYSDTEIIKYLTKNTGKTCGRFSPEQLNRSLEIEKPYPAYRFYTFFAGIALFLGVQQITYSQTVEVNQNLPVEQSADSTALPTIPVTQKKIKKDSLITITGQVLDSATNEPLYGAAVLIKGTKFGASADMDGKFKISGPASQVASKILLEVRCVAFQTAVIAVNPNSITNITIPLKEMFLGEFVGIIVYTSPWQRFKHRVSNFFKRIF
jgi:hypothetical protein